MLVRVFLLLALLSAATLFPVGNRSHADGLYVMDSDPSVAITLIKHGDDDFDDERRFRYRYRDDDERFRYRYRERDDHEREFFDDHGDHGRHEGELEYEVDDGDLEIELDD